MRFPGLTATGAPSEARQTPLLSQHIENDSSGLVTRQEQQQKACRE